LIPPKYAEKKGLDPSPSAFKTMRPVLSSIWRLDRMTVLADLADFLRDPNEIKQTHSPNGTFQAEI